MVRMTMSLRSRPMAAAALLVLTSLAARATQDTIPYPEGYRRWVHVSSALVAPGNPAAGFHHIYANERAETGYRTGHFADGAVIVFDRLEARTAGAATSEGARQVVDVMVRDSARYAGTGGWGFEEFVGDSRTERAVGPRAATACFGCHARRQDHDYVFGAFRP